MHATRKNSIFWITSTLLIVAALLLTVLSARADDHENYLAAVEKIKAVAQIKGRKINVVIIYTGGGGGHIAAADAVETVLTSSVSDFVKVTKINPFEDGFMGACADRAYKHLFEGQNWSLLRVGFFLQPLAERCIELSPARYLEKIQSASPEPDVFISVSPFANNLFGQFANDIGARYILIPTDFDASKFLHKVDTLDKNSGFQIFIPFENDFILGPYRRCNIISWVATGYPSRKKFIERARLLQDYESHDSMEIIGSQRQKYHIKDEDHVAVIGMGAHGFAEKTIKEYLAVINQHASEVNRPGSAVHVFIITGTNEELLETLKRTADTYSSINIHPLGFQDARGMALLLSPKFSDVFIGPVAS